MEKVKTLAIIMLATSALVACGGGGGGGGDSTTTTDTGTGGTNTATFGTATKSGDTYTLNSRGKTISATPNGSTSGGKPVFLNPLTVDDQVTLFGALTSPKGTSDFVGAAAINPSAAYVGQSGTKSAPTATNEVVKYNGSLYIITPKSIETLSGGLSGTVDFGSGKFTASTDSDGVLALDGQVNGADVKGTSSYNGSAGKFEGGFYQAGAELNGVFVGDKNDYAGVFVTEKGGNSN